MPPVTVQDRRGRRHGGRSGNARRSTAAIEQLAWPVPLNPDHPTEPLPPEGVAAIVAAALTILEDIGIEFLTEEAKEVLRASGGCTVDPHSDNVRMDRAWVREMIAKVPSEFTLTPRNPDRALRVGGKHMVFGNVSSPPNAMDLDRGRRSGDRESFRDLMKLTHSFNCIHLAGGYPVEPVDLHPATRHLDCLHDKILMTDKVIHAYSLGPERVEDGIEMARIGAGLTPEAFRAGHHIYTNINSSSPLKHDWPMLDGAMRFARANQPVFVTPFTLAGAMAPVTMAGAVTQSIAEGLAAIALLQEVRPGVPCVLGTFTSNVDMKSGAPAFGTPEYVRATQMTGQMARHYGLPLRASNACAANAPDAQAMWESLMSLWAAVTAGVNVVYHAAGWLEGGLIASYEKFVMDCEVLQQIERYFEPVLTNFDPETLAVEAIREVGPTGHFFGAEHTQERYQTAFYAPFLSDWRNYEAWASAGGVWTSDRANATWKAVLAEYEPPAIDPAIAEELGAFVARRKEEGGAVTDF
ncbi:MAG: trimethylamine methyltransferase family protein [Pseudomonadota bacterium]